MKCRYLVIITVPQEDDVLRRVALLNSAMFRILRETKLRRVTEANYRSGRLVMEVDGPPDNPAIEAGQTKIEVKQVIVPKGE